MRVVGAVLGDITTCGAPENETLKFTVVEGQVETVMTHDAVPL